MKSGEKTLLQDAGLGRHFEHPSPGLSDSVPPAGQVEPVAGLNPEETGEIAGLLQLLKQQGKSMLLIEHDMDLVMGVADRVVVLDGGRLIASGTPAEIMVNPLVLEAYLGRLSAIA